MEVMTDNELRGVLLERFYQERRSGRIKPSPQDFDIEITEREITRISRQLHDHGLLRGSFAGRDLNNPTGGLLEAAISARGIDVVEGITKPPISIQIRQSRVEDRRTFKEIEEAITKLSPEEVAQLLAWFADYQAEIWDKQIERDLDAGRLDALIDEVDAEYETGNARPL